MRIRMHGDFHLGQVLEADGDLFFIDFEGEPARPIGRATRAAVAAAGCRRHAALVRLRRARGFADLPAPQTRCGAGTVDARVGRRGVAHLRVRYLKQFGDAAVLPNSAARDVLLQAFVLDKAIYELAYELGNRPDWVDIPLDGLLGLLEA